MKKAFLGGILLIIGLTIISPIEELLILVPLSIYYSLPELILIFNAIAILSLIGAVYLLGNSKITGALHKHWKMAIISVAIVTIYAYWYLI